MVDPAVALAGLVTDVRLRAEAALLRRLDVGADARHVFVGDPDALARIAGSSLRPQGSHRKAITELAAIIAHHEVDVGATRVALVVERFGLDQIAGGMLIVALAYAIDLDTRELCHALAPGRPPKLYLEAVADVMTVAPSLILRAAAAGAPLRRGRLVTLEGDGLAADLAIASGALAWILGDNMIQPPLASVVELIGPTTDLGVELPPATREAIDKLGQRLAAIHRDDVAIVIRGPRGSGRRAAAHRLVSSLGRPVLVISCPQLIAIEKRTKNALLGHAFAAARLRDAVPFLVEADALWIEGELAPDHADAIAHATGAIIAGSAGRSGHLELGRPTLTLTMARAELDDRERSWRRAIDSGDQALELAGRYVIGPGAIADVAAEARRYATAAGTAVDQDALEAAVGRRLSLRLGTFGTVVSRKARFAELVLPDEVVDTLRDMVAMVRERAQILERWGYQRHLGISRGVAGMYSGEPGTGKTMAASVVASELGLELVRIDLSAVVSKYVGETEKNLAKIFDEAQEAHAMLLFDEADSLFGKRTELKSAQDRFANLEINYILQRMETFDGVSVLTTNAEAAIDPALQRRLNFRIRFPEPEIDEREKLWRQLLPPQTALHDHVDFHALAERFDMTGGYIKNAVVRAAVIAARAGRAMVA
ncbi:MAG TPA: AAA family ATPase, partial [Kofleriaceae bacterium]|nr:AAA family ATPase [Kofleriaceae bacterium]